MAPYETLVKCSFCPVRDRGEVGIAIGCVSVYLYAFENLRGLVISKWFFAIVEGLLWYMDPYLTIYERLRDYKVNLSYSKWEVSVITKTIFPIVYIQYLVLYIGILDILICSYERLRDSKADLSYYKWEVSVITKRIFPI